MWLGRVAAREGRLRSASRHLRESAAVMCENSGWGRPSLLPLGERATVEALLGDIPRAQDLLRRGLLDQPESYRSFHIFAVQTAQPWILAAQGRTRDAVDWAVRSADEARGKELLVWEAEQLHVPVRLGEPQATVTRLVALAEECDARHIQLYAQHADALVRRDPDALDSTCSGLADIGLMLHAAEVAAHAAVVWHGAGRATRSRRSAERSHQLALHCEGAMTPALLACRVPGLTSRERDVARLAAEGRTSQQIGQQLTMSVRTVDNHLYRVYGKLEVKGRRELRAALALPDVAADDDLSGQ
jgi:DNA-binding CsgD family transcriptional regulator